MKNPTFWIVMSIILLIIVYIVCHINNGHILDSHWDYYEATEQLLDKAYDMNPEFMDSVMQTPEYYQYEQARELL